MAQKFISLLYPTAELQAYHETRANLPDISDEVCEELGLYEIFALKSSSLTEFFTEDPEVIRYRQATLEDLIRTPELLELLEPGTRRVRLGGGRGRGGYADDAHPRQKHGVSHKGDKSGKGGSRPARARAKNIHKLRQKIMPEGKKVGTKRT